MFLQLFISHGAGGRTLQHVSYDLALLPGWDWVGPLQAIPRFSQTSFLVRGCRG